MLFEEFFGKEIHLTHADGETYEATIKNVKHNSAGDPFYQVCYRSRLRDGKKFTEEASEAPCDILDVEECDCASQ